MNKCSTYTTPIRDCDADTATEQIIRKLALMTIIEHAEKYLGKIDQGWKDKNSDLGIQIVSFRDNPDNEITTFLSLGLSSSVLDLNKDKTVRQEFIFSTYSIFTPSLVVSFLMSLCEAIWVREKAVLRGEVISLSVELAHRIGFSAAYCTNPVFFDDEFSSFDDSSPPTIMVWIIPIYESEAAYIVNNGWERFEDLLEETDPDLCSLERDLII